MTVSIFGSSGFIGTHLVRHLEALGGEVHAFGSAPGSVIDPTSGVLNQNFELPDSDAVIYLSQSPFYRQVPKMAWHIHQVNSVTPLHVANLALEKGIKKFIYASSGNVYAPSFAPLKESDPLRRDNFYALSKVHAEEALGLLTPALDVTFVRFFGVYGPEQKGMLIHRLIDSIRTGVSIEVERKLGSAEADGGMKISLCYVEDACQILIKLIELGGPKYLNVAGPAGVSITEIANEIAAVLSLEANLKPSSRERQSDLIADLSCLKKYYDGRLTSFDVGIRKTLNI